MTREILFLHGFTQTGTSWDPVRRALPRGYRALAPDLRGHGNAGATAPVSLDAVLSDLEGLAPARFILCGYSMGGRIALHAALWPALRARVERLVLIGASPGLADDATRQERRRADEGLARDLEDMTIDAFDARWSQTAVLADQPPAIRAQARAERLRCEPAGLARALRGLGTGALPSLWPRLSEVSMPAALVVGERDAKFAAIARAMAAAMPHARTEIVSGAGHAVHLEAPRAVAELIV